MDTFFEEYLSRLHELLTDIEKSLEGLPQEAIDWQPQSGMNSLSVLVVHLTGSARYWIGDVGMGDPSNRNREAEFRVKGLQVEALSLRLRELEAYARAALEKLHLADLEMNRILPGERRQYTVAYALLHALEHTALHTGHIQLTRQLWQLRLSS